jgi:hypothetical protein
MADKLNLLKNNDNKNLEDQEWIQDFYNFLQGDCPEDLILQRGHQPKLSKKKAFAIIYYLQEILPIIPDSLEQCHNCGSIFDSDKEGLYWQSKGRDYCGNCDYLVPENYDKGKR